jgi:hypothetical protein
MHTFRVNCPNCGAGHETDMNWYCLACQSRLQRIGCSDHIDAAGNRRRTYDHDPATGLPTEPHFQVPS